MKSLPARVERLVRPALIDKVPRDHREPDEAFRRRRAVAVVTLVLGAVLLGLSLATDPGDAAFYPLTLAVALVWFLGGILSGPLHLGAIEFRGSLRRPVVTPLALGLAAAAVFVVGGLVIREIGPLRNVVNDVLQHAQQGNLALVFVLTLVNGAAEEVFFRGALYAAVGQHRPVLVSTVVYVVVTIATGNVMLVFAAVLMGTLFGLQRRASGGILASMITHLVWSTAMILVLPPLLAR